MASVLSAVLEKALNQYLRLDPDGLRAFYAVSIARCTLYRTPATFAYWISSRESPIRGCAERH